MSAKASYEKKAEAKFAEAQAQLSALAARAKGAVAGGRKKGERLLKAAQSKHDQALQRLEQLKRAGEEGWESLQSTFETAWSELRHALDSKD